MRWMAFVAALAFLAGCGQILTNTGIGEVVSLTATDKTIGDHVISLASGKNCSSVRRQADLTYCVEDEPTLRTQVFCYRNIGKVTCYDSPDPRYQQVNLEYENTLKRKP